MGAPRLDTGMRSARRCHRLTDPWDRQREVEERLPRARDAAAAHAHDGRAQLAAEDLVELREQNLTLLLVATAALLMPLSLLLAALSRLGGDHYTALGVPRGATADVIKKAYRNIAMKDHPDRLPRSATSAQREAATGLPQAPGRAAPTPSAPSA